MEQEQFGASPVPTKSVAATHVGAATASSTSGDVAAMSPHRFTMTVEDVAAQLNTYGVDRDVRTIQRWCKSGKMKAIIDHVNGDRWLVEPSSVQTVVDDILQELSRQPRAFSPLPRRRPDATAQRPSLSRRHDDIRQTTPVLEDVTADDNVASPEPVAATSEPVDVNVAALKKRVSELEMENIHLKADVRSRESFNEYIKEQFESMLENTLDRTELVGRLQAENAQLRAALPERSETPNQVQFSPQVPSDEMHSNEPMNPNSYVPRNNRSYFGGQ